MQIPFTIKEFFEVFKNYNQSVFPIQIIFYLLVFYGLYLLFKNHKHKNIFLNSLIAFLWLWIGIVYQLIFFTTINKAAYAFGILFIIQGFMFAYFGAYKNLVSFKFSNSVSVITGIIFIVYALIIYPILGYLLGNQYPYSPTFGLPCPTVIFTFGLLLFTDDKIPVYLLIIPLLWSLIGFSAAVNLSVYEDFGLLIAGLLGFVLIIFSNRKFSTKYNAN